MPRRLAITLSGAGEGAQLDAALALADRVPVSLALDCDALMALARTQPERLLHMRSAFESGHLRPLLTTAHRASPALLAAAELADELRLDEELVQSLFGVTLSPRGFVGVADVAALEQAGVDFVLAHADVEPQRVGERLIALPSLRWSLSTLDLVVALETIDRLQSEGVAIVGADELAASLTAPWLTRGEPETEDVPASLRALADVTGWCLDAFALPRVPGIAAAALAEEGWRLERFSARARLPLARRRGLAAERRAFVAAYEVCDVLAVETRVPGTRIRAAVALGARVMPLLAALADEHGAGDPMARACAAYDELVAFGFVGALRWRAFLTGLRDAFALLASRRAVDWSVVPAAAPEAHEEWREPLYASEAGGAALN
ncbi:MAG TPA: hypothetical protein VIA18_10220 [Polyangia bacterium]|nr:hypothetical protein [Polyangia bacterium]